jgi:sulfur-carrier protein adenylyltransferase/sulfurtransferase
MTITHLTHEALMTALAEQPTLQLVDVRTPEEYFGYGHIPGALLCPVQTFADHAPQLDPQRPVVVYCQHGVRSLYASEYLVQQGFTDVQNLAEGFHTWPGAVSFDA